jgi:hypothetical protein
VRWREDIVANLLLNHIEALSIDTVSKKKIFLSAKDTDTALIKVICI